MYSSTLSLTSALDVGQRQAPAALPGTLRTVGWVGPGVSLDG